MCTGHTHLPHEHTALGAQPPLAPAGLVPTPRDVLALCNPELRPLGLAASIFSRSTASDGGCLGQSLPWAHSRTHTRTHFCVRTHTCLLCHGHTVLPSTSPSSHSHRPLHLVPRCTRLPCTAAPGPPCAVTLRCGPALPALPHPGWPSPRPQAGLEGEVRDVLWLPGLWPPRANT